MVFVFPRSSDRYQCPKEISNVKKIFFLYNKSGHFTSRPHVFPVANGHSNCWAMETHIEGYADPPERSSDTNAFLVQIPKTRVNGNYTPKEVLPLSQLPEFRDRKLPPQQAPRHSCFPQRVISFRNRPSPSCNVEYILF